MKKYRDSYLTRIYWKSRGFLKFTRLLRLLLFTLITLLFNRCGVVDNSVNFQYEKIYCFNYPLDTLKMKISKLENIDNYFQAVIQNYEIDSTGKYKINPYSNDTILAKQNPLYNIIKDTNDLIMKGFVGCSVYPTIIISGDSSKSKLELHNINYDFPGNFASAGDEKKKELLEIFESKIILKLKE
ncbi:MAG: hypothetical protein WCK02_12400 [Bacteroidota bacterium]